MKVCEYCGKEFVQLDVDNMKFCSKKCKFAKSKEIRDAKALADAKEKYINKRRKLTIAEVCILAKAEGLTYSQFVEQHELY